MKVSDLKKLFPQIQFESDFEIDLSQLKRSNLNFKKQDVFVAIAGNSWDGHNFIEEAKSLASLIIYEENKYTGSIPASVAQMKSDDTRRDLAILANLLAGRPCSKMFTIGVTGTNGKTSTVSFLEQILSFDNHSIAVMGTIDHHLGDKIWNTDLTSPGPIEFYSRAKEMECLGAKVLSLEISSHALDQKRIEGIDLDVAIYTNLSPDHLDYHKTMDAYFRAKEKIASDLLQNSTKKRKTLILNGDDSCSKNFKNYPNISKLLVGKSKDCDLVISEIQLNLQGSKFYLEGAQSRMRVETGLLGEHNVYNLSLAIVAARVYGMSDEKILEACLYLKGAKGRLEGIENNKSLNVFVDFAHSPDALSNVGRFLKDLSKDTRAKIHCVFGAGGDRDKTKRSLMAKAVESFADFIYVTSDNPRSEDPQSIVEDIKNGFSKNILSSIYENVDRRETIIKAISCMKSGDVLLVAGKGHEAYQEIKGVKLSFSDQECIAEQLKERK